MAAQDNWESRWEVVIGLETHTQLQTQSKIFSGAATAFGAEPNAQACAVDIALPGVLPVLNREAVVCAIKLGLAVGGEIAPRSIFARKNYFYPDLPKGYQISQYEIPVVSGGELAFWTGRADRNTEELKRVRLTRAHLEEDAGKSLHEDFQGKTGIDLNRAGTPLLEIVSEPDMRSAADAVAYAKALHALVQWIGICDGNMQEGSFRCDANVSVRRPGGPLGTRREIKNLNSFKFMQQAIDYEILWQINEIEEGRKIQQATVLFDPNKGETRAMRSKEDAQDYRYFPDPDLLPLEITSSWIEEVKKSLPELQGDMSQRLENEYAILEQDARLLTQSHTNARYFEETILCIADDPATPPTASLAEKKLAFGQDVAKWINGDLIAALNKREIPLEASPVTPLNSAQILIERSLDRISRKSSIEIMLAIIDEHLGGVNAVRDLIEERNLRQLSDALMIDAIIDGVLAANPKSVEEFRAGKDKAFNALVGQAMKATKGKANPQQVNDLLRKKLAT
jgi:aspartyl-tRNA(Asn)/glutamyl-tRNA(Gln) amidotransferase subunit B